jgi:predicted permease
MQHVDPGFRSDNILTFRVALPGSRYGSPDTFNAFGRQLQASLAAIPGVTGVGAISHMPYDNLPNWGGPYIAQAGQDEATAVFADHRAVTPGYFETVGVRLVAGRLFTEDDGPASDPVVIVDDQLARRTWPGGRAVGRRIASDPRSTGHPVFWATVVGVVHHVRHRSLIDDLTDQVYFADRQVLRNPMVYVVKAPNAAGLAPAVKSIVAKMDSQLPVYDIRLMDDFVVAARAAQRFTTILALAFAVVALLLAAVGVYGVVAYAVTRRRLEFGVRLALGARPRSVVALVMREGVSLAAVGIAIGGAGAAMAARLLEQQLFGVTATDAISYATAAAAITAAAMLATWLPASQASAISPMDALRAD